MDSILGEEIRPGLRTWTAYHDEWEKHVRGFAIVESERLVLIDPLLAGDQWDDLDAMRVHSGLDVVLTIHFHARSTAEIRERHPDAKVWAFAPDREEIEKRTPVDRSFEAGENLPGGLVAIAAPPRQEIVLWDAAHQALIAGDVLLGDGEEGSHLHLAPEGWMGGDGSQATLSEALAPVLDLPVELVLTAHGEMVLGSAPEALRQALG
jgi:glyoxylase-like metal-dependent hydrolase (beta-lactamase superfamily II)